MESESLTDMSPPKAHGRLVKRHWYNSVLRGYHDEKYGGEIEYKTLVIKRAEMFLV